MSLLAWHLSAPSFGLPPPYAFSFQIPSKKHSKTVSSTQPKFIHLTLSQFFKGIRNCFRHVTGRHKPPRTECKPHHTIIHYHSHRPQPSLSYNAIHIRARFIHTAMAIILRSVIETVLQMIPTSICQTPNTQRVQSKKSKQNTNDVRNMCHLTFDLHFQHKMNQKTKRHRRTKKEHWNAKTRHLNDVPLHLQKSQY